MKFILPDPLTHAESLIGGKMWYTGTQHAWEPAGGLPG